MSTRKLRTVENLILITFPLVLFAGCAGSDVKPTQQEATEVNITKDEINDQSFSYMETASPVVSQMETESVNEDVIHTEKSTHIDTDSQLAGIPKTQDEPLALTTPEKKIFFFDTNNYLLSDEQRQELKQHADYLLANPETQLVINGHADVRGTENYNQTLSEKRARETLHILTELGVPKNQILTKGFGELIPMNDEGNWDENRRVELQYLDNVMLSAM